MQEKLSKSQLIKDKKNRYKFYFLVIFIAFFLLIKMNSSPIPQTIAVTLLKQQGRIESLETLKNTQLKIHFTIAEINFPKNQELYYEHTGNLGYKNNFFLILKTTMDVKKEGFYQFSVSSDDGFKLSIDNQLLCLYESTRAMEQTLCRPLKLSRGEHKFKLEYFQAYGDLGLIAEYSFSNKMTGKAEYKKIKIGQDSPQISFSLTTDEK